MTVTDILMAKKTGFSNDMAALLMARLLNTPTEGGENDGDTDQS